MNSQEMEIYPIIGQHFGFSGTRLDLLGASEYTLCSLIVDSSGSVTPFIKEMEKAIQEVYKSCQRSPRADNLMLRVVKFDNTVIEQHGFKLLSMCNPDTYNGFLHPGGSTALYESASNAIEATSLYAETLSKNDFSVNGVVFLITDGCNNMGWTPEDVKQSVDKCITSEHLESMTVVLIGVNIQDPSVSRELTDFQTRAGITQYIELDNADEKTLAKLAQFVSRSISSVSQSLGTGAASQALTF